ncbi:MAG: pyridoxamine 5'-phosphate oxidase family protein [Cyanobacteria bacterium J06634_6]
MALTGWTRRESPFHRGELAIQTRLGVKEKIDRQGRRMIRDYLIPQHRQFFSQLSYALFGSLDTKNQPWTSILVGKPGFLSSPNEQTLRVATTLLPGDPLINNLTEGMAIGLLGIDLATRRRNRINGTVIKVESAFFDVQVAQSFGNCPQYIQARSFEWIDVPGETEGKNEEVCRGECAIASLTDIEQRIIRAADTFFITTAYQKEQPSLSSGIDVSHRGGNPGFVNIADCNTLIVPDYSGNFHFNTLGNIELNPKVGLLFIDFKQGHVLHLTGTAEIIWDGPDVNRHEGAERLIHFRLKQGITVRNSLPLRWSAPEFSPFLENLSAKSGR